MSTKRYLYAAVGAPVVVAKTARERVETARKRLSARREESMKEAREQIDAWAGEGEKVVDRLTDSKTFDDFAAKVDFDQVQEQVSKLRDQLEDLLATWRANFRPAGATAEKSPAAVKAESDLERKAAEQKAAAAPAKPAPKTTAGKTATAKTATAKKPATARTGSARSTGAQKKPTPKAS